MDIFSITAFGISFLAWASYLPVSKSPRLRQTMWPTIALVGLALIFVTARIAARGPDEPRFELLDVISLAMTLLFVPVYFLALRVPRSGGRPQTGQKFPAVSFTADDGRVLSSSELTQRGPTLFVFFRGFW